MTHTNTIRDLGYLLHITHYDPAWCKVKAKERPFDLPTGLAVVAVVANAGVPLITAAVSPLTKPLKDAVNAGFTDPYVRLVLSAWMVNSAGLTTSVPLLKLPKV